MTEKQLKEYKEWVDSCMEKHGYYIHALTNDTPCSSDGKSSHDFIDGFCNVHTHGLGKSLDHKDFRFVCNHEMSLGQIQSWFEVFVKDIRNGERYNSGDTLTISDDGKSGYLKFTFVNDCDDEDTLRVIREDIPDEFRMQQYLPLDRLVRKNANKANS